MLLPYCDSLLRKKPSSGETLIELDGLRGFAVLIVIASHANTFNMKGQGTLGVWLFFVLSGFLLTKIILSKLPGSLEAKELAKYFIRRIARIIPLYYLCLTGAMLIRDHDRVWLFQHFVFMKSDGHFWSIPQEELFYVLLPALVALTYWGSRLLGGLAPWIIALIIAITVEMIHPIIYLNGNFSKIPFCINIFILGFLMGHLWKTKAGRAFVLSRRYNPALNILSLFLLFSILFTSKSHITFYQSFIDIPAASSAWPYSTASGVVCALILAITLKTGTWLNQIFSLRFIRLLGVLSFGLYLFHPFAMGFFRRSLHLEEGLPLFAASLLTTLAIALLMERVVERPCMDLGRKISSRLDGKPDKSALLTIP